MKKMTSMKNLTAKRHLTLATGVALSLLPLAVNAAPAHHAAKAPAKTATAMYQCSKCHMKVSAAVAKKDGYKDPMDGGKLVPMSKPTGGMKM